MVLLCRCTDTVIVTHYPVHNLAVIQLINCAVARTSCVLRHVFNDVSFVAITTV